MQQTTLSIQSMHCGACVRRVSQQLHQIPGVEVQEVNVGSARVRYAPEQVTPDAIARKLGDAGFPTTPVATA